MEQQLAESQWNPLTEGTSVSPHQTTVKERDVINRLEGQVDEQRKMRLNDAKQVEAKAAKIKEWVTNKLRDVSLNFDPFCYLTSHVIIIVFPKTISPFVRSSCFLGLFLFFLLHLTR